MSERLQERRSDVHRPKLITPTGDRCSFAVIRGYMDKVDKSEIDQCQKERLKITVPSGAKASDFLPKARAKRIIITDDSSRKWTEGTDV
jgi:hypothetical protein